MPDTSLPVSAADLLRFGFRESTAEAAAQEITGLVQVVFGPFDPEAAEGWAASEEQDLGPADLRGALAAAAKADDPLAFLAVLPDARVLLERRMAWRWSSRRARALGHPTSLQDQTWSTLSEVARTEVRENLKELAAFANTRVLRHRPEREDLDTFLSELAEIYVVHAQQAGDRAVRARHRLLRRTDVPHSPTSRFIRLADLILSRLSLPLADNDRLHPNWRSVRGLSERWKRRKEDELLGRRKGDTVSENTSQA
jgi:hypothetical protein